MTKKKLEKEFQVWANDMANEIKTNHEQSLKMYHGVYLAIMENGNFYDVEIEVSAGDIASTYSDGLSLKEARFLADRVETVFKEHKIHVYKTKEEWEDAIVENVPCVECGRVDLPLHFDRRCSSCKPL